jgi:hypothetical protein
MMNVHKFFRPRIPCGKVVVAPAALKNRGMRR